MTYRLTWTATTGKFAFWAIVKHGADIIGCQGATSASGRAEAIAFALEQARSYISACRRRRSVEELLT